jgi:hypothetical protein
MRWEDIPKHLKRDFYCYFQEHFHDEEEDADPETFGLCNDIDECFDKIGFARMEQAFDEFTCQSEEYRLFAYSIDDGNW